MKKIPKKIWLVLLFVSCAAAVVMAAEKMMSVQSKEAPVRADHEPFAQILEVLNYGGCVTVMDKKGAWTQVRTQKGTTGWTPTMSLTEKKLTAQGGVTGAASITSSAEIDLAAKLFTDEVEKQY